MSLTIMNSSKKLNESNEKEPLEKNLNELKQNKQGEQKEDLKQFLTEFKKSDEFQKMVIPRSSTLTELQAKEVVAIFAEKQKISINQSLTVITLLFQSGGTNKSCDGNLLIRIFGKEFKLANLRKVLAECKLKAGERKLARFLANDIATIALELEIPGNLAKQIQRDYPQRKFTMEETVWLSEFQVDNPKCPEESRQLISDTFKNRKNKQNSKNNPRK